MDWGFYLGLIVIGIVLYFLLWAPPMPVFVVRIRNGVATLSNGKVTDAFLQEVTAQCAAAGIDTAEVRGVPWGSQIRLSFKSVPQEVQQRLRNWWTLHGWRNGRAAT